MISTITFEHGEKTCAISKGVFCRWQGAMKFGTLPVCMLFDNEPLWEGKPCGWLMRCKQCVEMFGGDGAPTAFLPGEYERMTERGSKAWSEHGATETSNA